MAFYGEAVPGDGFDADWEDESEWAECVFDETFVAQAALTEPSAEERIRRAVRQRRAIDLDTRLTAEYRGVGEVSEFTDSDAHRRMASQGRWLRRLIAMLVVTALVLGGVVLSSESASREPLRPAVGLDEDPTLSEVSSLEARPTRTVSNGVRLGEPNAAPRGTGGYRFLATEPGSTQPVTYDPCREIHYVVNTDDAPVGADDVLRTAISRLGEVTGLAFSDDGSSTEQPGTNRSPFQPDRYGDRWAPVIIWWTTPQRAPRLAGDVAGYAGSLMIDSADPQLPALRTYVSGEVVLDGPQLSDVLKRPGGGPAMVRAVLLHELGHLVGLAHVDDPAQLMYPTASTRTDFADGDLRGLRDLGLGRCVASL